MVSEKKIIGLSEKVKIQGRDKVMDVQAKIDTGATKSSIDFELASQLKLGPVIKTKLVKSASGNALRPVVKVDLTISGKEVNAEFTLADRNHLRYQILVGQNILNKGFLIDPSK